MSWQLSGSLQDHLRSAIQDVRSAIAHLFPALTGVSSVRHQHRKLMQTSRMACSNLCALLTVPICRCQGGAIDASPIYSWVGTMKRWGGWAI